MRKARSRGTSLLDVVGAGALASVLLGVFASRLVSQARELAFARSEARARVALTDAWERVSAGAIALPRAGEKLALPPHDGVVVTLALSTDPVDAPLLREGALVAIELSVPPEHDRPRRRLVALVKRGAR